MPVEKTTESRRGNEGSEQGAQVVIEDQRVEVKERLGSHDQLQSIIEALFGGEEARREAIALIPTDQLDRLQKMVGKNGQGSLHKAIIDKRNEAFVKQVEALGFEMSILHPGIARGVFLIKHNNGVNEGELLSKINPIAQNLRIKAQLTTSRIDIAGERHITVAFEDPNTD